MNYWDRVKSLIKEGVEPRDITPYDINDRYPPGCICGEIKDEGLVVLVVEEKQGSTRAIDRIFIHISCYNKSRREALNES